METEHIVNCNQIDISLLRIPSANFCPLKRCIWKEREIEHQKTEKCIHTFTLLIGVNQRARLV